MFDPMSRLQTGWRTLGNIKLFAAVVGILVVGAITMTDKAVAWYRANTDQTKPVDDIQVMSVLSEASAGLEVYRRLTGAYPTALAHLDEEKITHVVFPAQLSYSRTETGYELSYGSRPAPPFDEARVLDLERQFYQARAFHTPPFGEPKDWRIQLTEDDPKLKAAIDELRSLR